MKILISGATGLIGSALEAFLKQAGHSVYRLVRHPLSSDDRRWDPSSGFLDSKDLEDIDAIVNLAGENIGGRWKASKKKALIASRLQSTRLLVETFPKLNRLPKVFLNASAIGYYGDRGEEILSEESRSGSGFLADLCRQWEAAAAPAEKLGVRLVCLRIGIVLSREGGALRKMLTPFKMGLGGVIGTGRQYMSWIAIDDLVRIVDYALSHPLHGAVNAVSPSPVTNREFTKTLGAVLHRPTVLPLPAFAVNLLLGEMGQELLLSSQRVLPDRLQQSGYVFLYPALQPALTHISQHD